MKQNQLINIKMSNIKCKQKYLQLKLNYKNKTKKYYNIKKEVHTKIKLKNK